MDTASVDTLPAAEAHMPQLGKIREFMATLQRAAQVTAGIQDRSDSDVEPIALPALIITADTPAAAHRQAAELLDSAPDLTVRFQHLARVAMGSQRDEHGHDESEWEYQLIVVLADRALGDDATVSADEATA